MAILVEECSETQGTGSSGALRTRARGSIHALARPLIAGLALAGANCGQEEPAPLCTPVGYWRATELPAGGACPTPDDVASELVLHVSTAAPTPGDERFQYELVRGGLRSSCTSVALESACRVELVCADGAHDGIAEVALDLDLGAKGALSGASRLLDPDGECRAEFLLRGERVSPLQLPETYLRGESGRQIAP